MKNRIFILGVRCFYKLVGQRLHWRVPGSRQVRGWCAHQICEDVRLPVTINARVGLPRSLRMGMNAGIGQGTQFLGLGRVSLGAHLTMGPDCLFITGDHPVPKAGGRFRDHAPVHEDIVVEEDVFLGARVTILPGVTIGRGAAVGAGSVVTKDVPAEMVVAGNPARVIRARAK
ncbi:acyltransferase [Streptomyces nodosus]|uniref:Acyltransferase n=1 Tax=Streptomyces nodosus TaxID=40318 RepID=A0A5P2W779_9ACTN|nr:acyltransferase [Streptomyces nodosus]MBB4792853.1 maltose O-acetyltransferase [Streptomyces nodosus]QEV40177.1 acyltransferase [Streptomyces nodosus]